MNPIDHSQMLIHVIFSTKNQQSFISKEVEPLLYDKISKILFDECYSPALIIGGDVEHIHIIYAQSREWSPDGVINRVKKRSTDFRKNGLPNLNGRKVTAHLRSAVRRMKSRKNTSPIKRNFTKRLPTKTNFGKF